MVGQLRRTSEVFLVLQPVREVEVNGDTLPAKPWYALFPSQNSCQRAVFDMNTLYTDPIRGRITDMYRAPRAPGPRLAEPKIYKACDIPVLSSYIGASTD